MKKRIDRVALVAVCLVANLGLDRVTKVLAETYLRGRDGFSLLGGLIIVRYAENRGAFLGMGAAWPGWLKYAVLLVGPALVCLYGLWYSVRATRSGLAAACLASAIAGGLGNLADRALNDFVVVDFLNFGLGGLRTGILNVADLSLTFGLLAYLLLELRAERAGSASVTGRPVDDARNDGRNN